MTTLTRQAGVIAASALLLAAFQAPTGATTAGRDGRAVSSGTSTTSAQTGDAALSAPVSMRRGWKCNRWKKNFPVTPVPARTCVKITSVNRKFSVHHRDGVDNRRSSRPVRLTCLTESSKTWNFGVKVGASISSKQQATSKAARAGAFRGLKGLTFGTLELSVEADIARSTTSVRGSHVEWRVPARRYLICERGVWKHHYKGIAVTQWNVDDEVKTVRANYISGTAPQPTIWRPVWKA